MRHKLTTKELLAMIRFGTYESFNLTKLRSGRIVAYFDGRERAIEKLDIQQWTQAMRVIEQKHKNEPVGLW